MPTADAMCHTGVLLLTLKAGMLGIQHVSRT